MRLSQKLSALNRAAMNRNMPDEAGGRSLAGLLLPPGGCGFSFSPVLQAHGRLSTDTFTRGAGRSESCPRWRQRTPEPAARAFYYFAV